MVQDITGLDYSGHPAPEGLGPIGDHQGRGLLVHIMLAIEAASRRVVGMAYQQVWIRDAQAHKGTESRTQRRARANRQSQRWVKAVAAVGTPLTPGADPIALPDQIAYPQHHQHAFEHANLIFHFPCPGGTVAFSSTLASFLPNQKRAFHPLLYFSSVCSPSTRIGKLVDGRFSLSYRLRMISCISGDA
jgi:hypothetical protein